MRKDKINPIDEYFDAIVFDFDGVLTDNRVFVDQNGNEQVCCHRGDGLAFDALQKLKVKVYIISTETNPVVAARAGKLKVPVWQGVRDKLATLKVLAQEKKIDLSRVLYVGNDLNDVHAMIACGQSACPSDSHKKVIEIATYHLKTPGGFGVVRELLEDVFHIDLADILYPT